MTAPLKMIRNRILLRFGLDVDDNEVVVVVPLLVLLPFCVNVEPRSKLLLLLLLLFVDVNEFVVVRKVLLLLLLLLLF